MRRSAQPTTSSATPASTRPAVARDSDAADAFGDIFGDVFGDIFGGGRRGRSQVFRGADLRYGMELDLDQAVFGDSIDIDFQTLAECEVCSGSGAAASSSPVTCDTCNGQGSVRVSQGFFSVQQTCPRCKGAGKSFRSPATTAMARAGFAARRL